MAPSKPFGVCWCDCHMPLDEDGRRIFQNLWPRYDDPVAVLAACKICTPDHERFIREGYDNLWPAHLQPRSTP